MERHDEVHRLKNCPLISLLLICATAATETTIEPPTGYGKAMAAVAKLPTGAKAARARVHLGVARMALNCAAEAAVERVDGSASLVELAAQQLEAAGSGSAGPAAITAESGPFVIVANERIGLLFKVTNRVADLRAIYHVPRNHQFLRWMIGTRPMWEIGTMRTKSWGPVINSSEPAEVTKALKEDGGAVELELTWNRRDPMVIVTVTCRLAAGDDLSHWTITIDGRDQELGMAEVAFPLVRGIGMVGGTLRDTKASWAKRSGAGELAEPEADAGNEPGDEEGKASETAAARHDFLAYPHKLGWLWVDPGKNANFSEHPRLQFMGYYTDDGKGLYIATQDPTGTTKRVEALADSGTLAASFVYVLPHANQPGHKTSYPGVIGVFEGDWYDSAQVYRRWAHKQKWCPRFPLDDARSTVPDWFKRTCVTLRASAKTPEMMEEQYEYAIKARDFYDAPVMVNWYQWFDSKNPKGMCDFTPYWSTVAFPNAAAVFQKGRDAGIPQVGYSLVKCYDTRLEAWETIGRKAAIHDLQGELYWQKYGGAPLASVCYSHRAYGDELAKELGRHAGEFNLDGTYSDLAGTNTIEVCFNAGHDHPPGGGTVMTDGQRRMLRAQREAARRHNPDFIIMTETPDETLFDVTDTFLTYMGFTPGVTRNIPLTPAVYGEFIRSYGSKGAGLTGAPKEGVLLAINWTHGSVLGRVFLPHIKSREIDYTKSRDHLKRREMAKLRHAAIDHLGMGRMLRPLTLSIKDSTVTDVPQIDFSVETTTWQARDRTVAFVFANTRYRPVTISYAIDPAEYGIPIDGAWALYQRDVDGKDTLRDEIRDPLKYTDKMGSLGVAVYIAKSK